MRPQQNHVAFAHPLASTAQRLTSTTLGLAAVALALVCAPASANMDPELSKALRIQKVGQVVLKVEKNTKLRPGEEAYKAQCSACHAAGVAGAPKFGDAEAWAPRIKTGFEALLQSALKGKNAMGPQGGGEFNDTEVGRAVAFMANAAGAKFAAPGPSAVGAAPVVAAETPPPVAAAEPAVKTVAVVSSAGGAGEALYKQACQVCHAAGVAGAPKFGNKADWAPRLQMGMDALFASAVKGKNAMPPRGSSNASDADLRAAVEYMAASAQ